MAKDLGCGVSEVGVDQLAWDDAVTVEGLAIGEVGVGHACIGSSIEPVSFKLLAFWWWSWSSVAE